MFVPNKFEMANYVEHALTNKFMGEKSTPRGNKD